MRRALVAVVQLINREDSAGSGSLLADDQCGRGPRDRAERSGRKGAHAYCPSSLRSRSQYGLRSTLSVKRFFVQHANRPALRMVTSPTILHEGL